jgi:hypothetical protein
MYNFVVVFDELRDEYNAIRFELHTGLGVGRMVVALINYRERE